MTSRNSREVLIFLVVKTQFLKIVTTIPTINNELLTLNSSW